MTEETKEQEKFIGPKKIKESVISPKLTYLKNSVVDIEYEDGTKESMPQKVFEVVVTDTVSDWSSLREKIVTPIVASILEVLLESECSTNYLDYMISKLKASVEENIKKAESCLWNKYVEDLTLADVHKILMDNQDNPLTKI